MWRIGRFVVCDISYSILLLINLETFNKLFTTPCHRFLFFHCTPWCVCTTFDPCLITNPFLVKREQLRMLHRFLIESVDNMERERERERTGI